MPSSSRVRPIVDSFSSVMTPGCRILDIGAGKGLLAQEMRQRFAAKVTMVDVAQYNQTDLPLAVCDSRALSFANHSFDFAILSFVLHHSPNPDALLGEALRVAARVIVIENDVRGAMRGVVTRMIDSWPAIQYGTPPCYITQSREAWLDTFKKFPVQVSVLKEFSLEFGFFRNITVMLAQHHTSSSRMKEPNGSNSSVS